MHFVAKKCIGISKCGLTVSFFHQSQRGKIVGAVGLEWLTTSQAFHKMGDGTVIGFLVGIGRIKGHRFLFIADQV